MIILIYVFKVYNLRPIYPRQKKKIICQGLPNLPPTVLQRGVIAIVRRWFFHKETPSKSTTHRRRRWDTLLFNIGLYLSWTCREVQLEYLCLVAMSIAFKQTFPNELLNDIDYDREAVSSMLPSLMASPDVLVLWPRALETAQLEIFW